jgi:hypothetical protein
VRHTARRWERRPLDGKIVLTPTTANDGSAAYEPGGAVRLRPGIPSGVGLSSSGMASPWRHHIPRQVRSGKTTASPADSHVLIFVSRADQLHLRGHRNYSRNIVFTKGFVKADGREPAQWQKKSAEDAVWDAECDQRHGPVDGGASILRRSHRHASLGDASEGTVLHLEDVKF